MTSVAKSILIFRIGQLGDSLVALPSFWALRSHFAGAKLTLLCDQHPEKSYVLGADLFSHGGLVDDFETYTIRRGFLIRLFHFGSLLAHLRSKKYDALVYLAPSGRTLSQIRRDFLFFRAAGIKEFFGMD